MLVTILILLLNTAYTDIAAVHDIHVSVSEIEIEDGEVEIVLKTFIDDLQLALGLEPGSPVPDTYSSSDEMIFTYLSDHIKLIIDGQEAKLDLVDVSNSTDAVWITMVGQVNPGNELIINVDLLNELYSDQTNLVKVNWQSKTETFLLNAKTTEAQVRL